ncbi:uncharacterized protein LOC122264160 [Penaeus japonicus]|uniref:uncharacterized protein LOC122264160 n=1 Tax=Penaeus japonicus TaxID=27405 RepID=UPI001C711B5C|nr:uncharacterized protein LOC122264160 [Penaeus japonicus]
MLALRSLLLGALMSCDFSFAIYVGDDCAVRDSIPFEKMLFGDIKFTAYSPSNGTVFKAKVTCDGENWYHDTFSVTHSTVTLQRFHASGEESVTYPAPPMEEGWNEFHIRFSKTYELGDDRGRSWIPGGFGLKCEVGSIDVSEGTFVASCPQGTPKWEVEGEKCARVPVPASKDAWKLDVSLASRYFFSPVVFLEEAKIHLGTSEGGSVTASSTNLSPLPPSTQRVLFSHASDGGIVSVKVLMAGKMVHAVTLRKEPREVKVCGKKGTKFMLVLNLEAKTLKMRKEPEDSKQDVVMLSVIGGMAALTVMLLAGCACLAYRLHALVQTRRESRSRGRDPSSRAQSEDPRKVALRHCPRPSSGYLEPRVGVPWSSPAVPRISSSPEHIYEEVDESTITFSRAGSSCSDPEYDNLSRNSVSSCSNADK